MELAKQKLLSEKFQSSQFLFFKDVCYILYILRVKIDLSSQHPKAQIFCQFLGQKFPILIDRYLP